MKNINKDFNISSSTGEKNNHLSKGIKEKKMMKT